MIEEQDHYIICLEQQSIERTALFWKPESRGYTSHIEQAGLFTKEDAERIETNTHKHNVAIHKEKLNSYFTVYSVAGFDSQTLLKLGVRK